VLTGTFGHDLVASYGALPARHRILSSDEVRLLTRVSENYAKQEFERIGVGRFRKSFKARFDLVGLEALAQKIMEHGDRMNLGQG
jgi:hypothetical protein